VGRAEKTLAAMERNPLDWRIEQVEAIADAYGLTLHRPGGSHCIVRHPNGKKVSIPAQRPIKPVYIRKFVRLVKFGTGDEA